jgi:UPF0755 protein
MKKAFYIASAVVLVFLAGSAWLVLQAYEFIYTAPENPGREVTVHIEPGMSFDQAARLLQDKGVVSDADKFKLLAGWKSKQGRVQAGELVLNTGWTPLTVLNALTSGPPKLYKIVVPEGLTWWQTARLVEKTGLTDFESFKRACFDEQLIAKYQVPADNAEGFLFPETYHVSRPRGGDAAPIVETMLEAFWNQAGETLWPGKQPAEVADKELMSLVTLASMVEKETGDPSERDVIAGVYANRLERRMLLQCDPTVIYGLGPSFGGNLKRSHLRDKSNPYSTYVRPGLPPGPICSPGLDALQAAKDPQEHSFLYFVSKGDGTHYFSKNLKEHNRAVRKYQLRR